MADNGDGGGEGQGGGEARTVPYERFEKVVSSKNALTSRVATLEGELQTLSEKAATVDTLGSQLREAQEQVAAAEAKFGRWQSIASALGTTDSEAIEAAEWAHSRLPQEDRPELGDWLGSIKEAPDKAPRVLRSWLQSDEGGQGGDEPPEASKRKPPRPAGGGKQPPGAPDALSAAELRRVREDAIRTGDWSRWKEIRKNFGGT